jgi:hypothetical protein
LATAAAVPRGPCGHEKIADFLNKNFAKNRRDFFEEFSRKQNIFAKQNFVIFRENLPIFAL